MATALKSAFDAALWFVDQALEHSEYLQPHKLQRLLFLGQAYYMVLYEGKLLMPAYFVADEIGPVEPNIFAAFVAGRPNIEPDLFLPDDAEQLLNSVWRRFGHKQTNALNEITNDTAAYKKALKRGHRAEILAQDMMMSFARGDAAPAADQLVRPKLFRTQQGKPVQVKAWEPKRTARIREEPPESPPPKRKPSPKPATKKAPVEPRQPEAAPASPFAGVKRVSKETEVFRSSAPTRGRMPGPTGTAMDPFELMEKLQARGNAQPEEGHGQPVSAETGKPVKVTKAPWVK
ncbi:MAG: hypothetical protein ACPGOV_09440 [Magnetovibrionaceae bacterium]